MKKTKRVTPTVRKMKQLRADLEEMTRRAQAAEGQVLVYKRDAELALSGQRKAARDLAAEQKRVAVRTTARLAALASCRAMMDFAARAAPMIMEGAKREKLIELVEECSAMRFREERHLKAKWMREMQDAFNRQEDEP